MTRVLAVIPARAGSKRLPGKNARPLFGKPLVAWTIEFARSIPWFDEIHVSTDGAEIAEIARRHGAEVPRLRPAALAADETSSVDVVLELLDWYERAGTRFDTIALLQPTTPVRVASRWEQARALLADPACDGAIGVCDARTHPYLAVREATDGYLQPWLADAAPQRSQDLPAAYAINGALYLVKIAALRAERGFRPRRCRAVVCSEPVENLDIDTAADWRSAELTIADWRQAA